MKYCIAILMSVLLFTGCQKKSTLYNEDVLLKNSVETYISTKEEITEKQARILEIAHYKKPFVCYNLIRELNGKELIHLCNDYLTPNGKRTLQTQKFEVFDWELGDYMPLHSDYKPSTLSVWRNYGAEHYDEIVAWEYSINGTFYTKQGFIRKGATLLIVLFKGMMIINK